MQIVRIQASLSEKQAQHVLFKCPLCTFNSNATITLCPDAPRDDQETNHGA